jgi:hypothetical protein
MFNLQNIQVAFQKCLSYVIIFCAETRYIRLFYYLSSLVVMFKYVSGVITWSGLLGLTGCLGIGVIGSAILSVILLKFFNIKGAYQIWLCSTQTRLSFSDAPITEDVAREDQQGILKRFFGVERVSHNFLARAYIICSIPWKAFVRSLDWIFTRKTFAEWLIVCAVLTMVLGATLLLLPSVALALHVSLTPFIFSVLELSFMAIVMFACLCHNILPISLMNDTASYQYTKKSMLVLIHESTVILVGGGLVYSNLYFNIFDAQLISILCLILITLCFLYQYVCSRNYFRLPMQALLTLSSIKLFFVGLPMILSLPIVMSSTLLLNVCVGLMVGTMILAYKINQMLKTVHFQPEELAFKEILESCTYPKKVRYQFFKYIHEIIPYFLTSDFFRPWQCPGFRAMDNLIRYELTVSVLSKESYVFCNSAVPAYLSLMQRVHSHLFEDQVLELRGTSYQQVHHWCVLKILMLVDACKPELLTQEDLQSYFRLLLASDIECFGCEDLLQKVSQSDSFAMLSKEINEIKDQSSIETVEVQAALIQKYTNKTFKAVLSDQGSFFCLLSFGSFLAISPKQVEYFIKKDGFFCFDWVKTRADQFRCNMQSMCDSPDAKKFSYMAYMMIRMCESLGTTQDLDESWSNDDPDFRNRLRNQTKEVKSNALISALFQAMRDMTRQNNGADQVDDVDAAKKNPICFAGCVAKLAEVCFRILDPSGLEPPKHHSSFEIKGLVDTLDYHPQVMPKMGGILTHQIQQLCSAALLCFSREDSQIKFKEVRGSIEYVDETEHYMAENTQLKERIKAAIYQMLISQKSESSINDKVNVLIRQMNEHFKLKQMEFKDLPKEYHDELDQIIDVCIESMMLTKEDWKAYQVQLHRQIAPAAALAASLKPSGVPVRSHSESFQASRLGTCP